ncbi:MAG TPA: flagellar basal body rod protein FlgC [Candidatus Dormibacteraeota bacterium]|nr:flagellar basal body rod protein FlgC [Candidatus Dormibacteraeota bacterium]
MNLFRVLEISGSALLAERIRAEVTAANLANAETTRTETGGPYQRMNVVFGARPVGFQNFNGMMLASLADLHAEDVRVVSLVADNTPPIRRYEPGHPDADKDGYVAYPAINPAEEMVNLMGAARAYEMNASAVASTKNMIQTAITILS